MRSPRTAMVASANSKGGSFAAAAGAPGPAVSAARPPAPAARNWRRDRIGSSAGGCCGMGLVLARGARLGGGGGEAAEVYVDQRFGVLAQGEAARVQHPIGDDPGHARH